MSEPLHPNLNPFRNLQSESAEPYAGPYAQRGGSVARQRQLTLGDLLLENRVVFLEGPIDDGRANYLIMQMLYLQHENKKQPIHFYINSPGGSVTATLAIYDTMQFLECEVFTYVVGMAASGAAVLLCGGSKGKRFALPNSTVMIHQPHGQIGGQVSDIDIQCEYMLQNKRRISEIIAHHTGQSYEKVAADTERDRFLTAQQSKEYGIVDDVLSKHVEEKPQLPE